MNGRVIMYADSITKIRALGAEMFAAAENLDFERAAKMRDELKKMQALAGKEGALDAGAFYDPYADAPKKTTKGKSSRGAARASGATAATPSSRPSSPARAKASGRRGRYKR